MKLVTALASASLLIFCSACGDDASAPAGFTCESGLVDCGGSCVNPAVEPMYCGASSDCSGTDVGAICDLNSACVAGACLRIDSCDTSLAGTPGIGFSAASADSVEGQGPVSYSVTLDSEPCSNVYLTLTSDAQVDASVESLLFTPENWDQAQTVLATAVHDFDIEGDHTGVVNHTIASGDARYTALVDAAFDIVVKDRAHLTHVSYSALGLGSGGDSLTPSVSDDGRWVAFNSDAADLASGDSASYSDVFLHDALEGTTTRISLAGIEADGASTQPQISADGRRVVYFSEATNLTDAAITGAGEIYLYDANDGTTNVVTGPCANCSNNELGSAGISGDGTAIAFATRRRYLSDTENEYDMFVAREDGPRMQASLNSASQNGTTYWGSNAFGRSISATGEFVGFNSAARNLGMPDLTVQNFHSYVKNMIDGTLTRVSAHSGGNSPCDGSFQSGSSSAPVISADGNLAAFQSDCIFTLSTGSDTNALRDIMVRDITAQTTKRVNIASDGTEADGVSALLGMSDNGTYVLFRSQATNLVAEDTNATADLFVHNTVTSLTTRISVGMDYSELTLAVTDATISRNGQFVVFTTTENLLDSDDNTELSDVYKIQLF